MNLNQAVRLLHDFHSGALHMQTAGPAQLTCIAI